MGDGKEVERVTTRVKHESVLDNVKIIHRQNNITEAIDTDYLYKWTPATPVFISAQTGSGKNTFVKETLIRKLVSFGINILIMSNRIALSRQEKRSIAELMDEVCPSKTTRTYVEELDRYSFQMLDEFENIGNVTIKSYQSFLTRQENLFQDYHFIIFDECHFFLADATFNKSTYNVLTNILQKYDNAVRVYMSATCDDVFIPIIEAEQKYNKPYKQKLRAYPIIFGFLPIYRSDWEKTWNWQWNQYTLINHCTLEGFKKCEPISIKKEVIHFSNFMLQAEDRNIIKETFETFNDNSAVIYEFERSYEYVQCKYLSINKEQINNSDSIDKQFLQYQPLIDLIKKQIITEQKINSTSKTKTDNEIIEKWLVFVGKKELGQKLLESIGSSYASYIDSRSKYSNKDDGLVYKKICDEGTFDKKVLITTSVLDNGINIKDPQVKHIAILVFDKVSFLQMLGRKRIKKNQEVILYIQEFVKNSLNGVWRKAKSKLTRIEQANDINKHNEIIKEIINNDEVFYYNQIYPLNGAIGYNLFLKNKLENDIKLLEKILKNKHSAFENDTMEIREFGKQTIIEQLSWLKKEDSFDPLNYLETSEEEKIKKEKNINNFLEFLESKCCKEEIPEEGTKRRQFFRTMGMNQAQQEDFCIKFSEMYNTAYIAKKTMKVYKKKTITNLLKEKGLQYEIEAQSLKNTAIEKKEYGEEKDSTTVWILIKTDNKLVSEI